MRKRILRDYVLVVTAALLCGFLIFYLVVSNIMMESTRRDLEYVLQTIRSIPVENLVEQKDDLSDSLRGDDSRLTIIDEDGTVLLDSVTALLANEMFSPFNPAAPEKALRALLVLGRHCRHVLCVADDIFRDAGRYTGWTEDYRAGLARICRGLAGEFDLVCEAQAGMLRVHKGRLPAGLDCQKTPLGFSDRSLQSATRRNCGP